MKSKHIPLISLFLIIVSIYILSSVDFGQRKNIHIIFRYDDYSALSNTAAEQEILEVFEKYHVPLTIGVIPYAISNTYNPVPQQVFPLEGAKLEILKTTVEKGIAEIALHGYSHQANTDKSLSEFLGLPLSRQVELINGGKTFLQEALNTDISIFIPPWNSYDQNTINALDALSFSTLSANKDGLIPESSRLNILPATCSVDEVQEAVITARQSSTREPILVVLFHGYDFIEVDADRGTITYPEFSEIMAWLSSQDDVTILSIGLAVQKFEGLSADRFARAQNRTPQEVFIESSLGEEQINDVLYRGEAISSFAWMQAISFYLLITFTFAFLAFFVAGWLYQSRRGILKCFSILSAVVSAILIFYVFSDEYVYRIGMMIIAASVGISIGLLANNWTGFPLRSSEKKNHLTPLVWKNNAKHRHLR